MSLTVVILDSDEKFVQFLDNELLSLTETHEVYGLRTLKLEYNIDSIDEAKSLFKSGNKIWVTGDTSLTDCLYVINSNVEKDLFNENKVTLEAEEILVELNYAQPFLQTEITASNGFTINKQNSQDYVAVNYYFLNYWFGKYFQIGTVQECLTKHASRIAPTGIMSLMELLRFIEEETGNIFRTRYEKDTQTNVIHRYLDFLNPDSSDVNWEVFLEYTIPEIDDGSGTLIDEDGNEISTEELDHEDLDDEIIDPEDIIVFPENVEPVYYDPEDLTFQLLNEDLEVLGSWNGADIGVEVNQGNLIRMAYKINEGLVCQCNGKTFAEISDTITDNVEIYTDFVDEDDYPFISIGEDPNRVEVLLENHSIFQVLANDEIISQQTVNPLIGDVHEEVLDLGYNIENIEYDVNESDTFNSIMPILSLSENEGLTKTDMDKIINNWMNLSVTKGELIPMIIQRVTTTGTKTTGIRSNYYSKPCKPNDNVENNQYDYFAAVAYRTAPFNKNAGEPYIYDDTITGIEYTHIQGRPDINETRGKQFHPKIGPVESSDEDPFAIYNDVANKLKEKKYPEVTVNVDVANYKNRRFNDYQLWDKVYLKLPGYKELITARVEKINKSSNDLAENNVTLGTYSINTTIPQAQTVLYGDNVNFDYPATGKLTVQLADMNDVPLPNKLLTFSSNSSDQNASPNSVYNVRTNSQGYATISMKYNPGQYTLSVYYGGDELYEPVNATFDVSVGGTLPEPVEKTTPKAIKTVSKTATKKDKTVKTKKEKIFWSKCGLSPDKKHKQIISIAQPSASESDMRKYGVNYHTIYKTIFKNKCPYCGHAALRYDDGKKNGCITNHGHSGNKKEVPEGEITCHHCDSDFDGVTGLEKSNRHSGRLTMIKKPVKSSKSEKAKLIKGKLVYGTKTVKVTKKKNNKKTKDRSAPIGSVSKKVKEKALKLAKGKYHLEAARAIAEFMGDHIRYEQVQSKVSGFTRSPENVLSSGMGNCCSQTRLMLKMMDAAGVTEKYKLYYIHINSGKYGHVFARIVSKKTGKGVYVDPCKSNPWGHYINGKYGKIGSCPSSRYPRQPF